ncbi:MAG: DUF4097 domain-containing protein [Acidobacteria bacterium]|nr:DUF4097 domain-containing protein [Acidobacteriota bacterium]MDW7984631.1 DUF4097 family beta strand repeat-containing protein [Acidobacteriota bacterium]
MVRFISWASLALGLLVAYGSGWAYRAEGRFERNPSVGTPVRLTVENPHGAVRVRRGGPGRVHVVGHVTIRAFSRKQAQSWLQRILTDPPVIQADGDIRIEWPAWARRSWSVFGGPWGLRVDYTIDVPPETNVRVKTGSGDVEVRDVDGPVWVHTLSGDVEVQTVQSAVEVRTGSGDVRVEEVRGDVEVRAGSGDVRLGSTIGRVTVRLGSGDLTADRVQGPVEASTGSGDIALTRVVGDVQVRAGSGDIRVRTYQTPTDRTWELATGSGEIEVALPETARFEVNARTRAGRVTVEFPLTTVWVQDRWQVRGIVGSADLRVEARAGSGSIRIRRVPLATD